ncbi:MAG: imidazoleglycerol-phosphate dehydratase HisB [Tissierellales bacterium]|nr:imidazoleglycerol-phosphate dehydratase HisB [Tissierellales bacterium]MBN2828223.1 imidazoleglycerol-phosphate dehydratase HisB [Tissierellales bacterium]
MRTSKISRKTKETDILIQFNLDGNGIAKINTGIGFLDHMLTLFAFHGGFDLEVNCKGDLEVDSHHTAEDIGLALGTAVYQALGDKKGIKRYASLYLPMDEALCRMAIDISGRPFLVYKVDLTRPYLGQMDTQNFEEFFRAFISESRITLHTEILYGNNDHHKIEAVFKAFGRALKEASEVIGDQVSSTKGVL